MDRSDGRGCRDPRQLGQCMEREVLTSGSLQKNEKLGFVQCMHRK